MNLLALPQYKKNLMGTSWWGEIDLTNSEQRKIFEFLNTDDNGNMKHGGEPDVYKNPEKKLREVDAFP